MEEQHQALIPDYDEAMGMIEQRTEEAMMAKLGRNQALKYVSSFLTFFVDRMKKFLNESIVSKIIINLGTFIYV